MNNIAAVVQLILTLVTQLLPLAEQLRGLMQTSSVSTEEMARIDSQLKTVHDRLGKLLGEIP